MSHDQPIVGPDLGAGIALNELNEGIPLFGQVDGEAVMIQRRGAVVYALSAVCTHYGGPLSEGLCTDGVIRCPWHHACFDMVTGAAVAAPALNPLARYRTEVRDGLVYVREKQVPDALEPRRRNEGGPASVVIIGAGAAGGAAAETLRSEGYAGPITMIDPDSSAPYDRPNLSKDYLAGTAPAEWLPLRPDDFYAAHGIERIGQAAQHIDVQANRVRLADNRTIEYGVLLLATGAEPIRPRIPGVDQPHVHVLRSLADCEALLQAIETKPRVVIAGASFIGLEAAAALHKQGIDATVVAPESVPFSRVLGPELGAVVHSMHVQRGVRFVLGNTIAEIGTDQVTLSDGQRLPAQLVLLGVGVQPRLELAQAAGLELDNGVLVNTYLQTSHSNIYAAGDICRYPDARTGDLIRVEHWVVAQRQGQTAARNMLGLQQPFDSIPFFWTQQHGLVLNYVGHTSGWDEVEVTGDPQAHDCRVAYSKSGVVLAVATIGRDIESLQAELEMEQSRTPADRAANLESLETQLPPGRK